MRYPSGDISVKNIKFIELIRNKKVLINKISFDDLAIRVFKNDKVKSPEKRMKNYFIRIQSC
ncbi:MAG: hypothetical protein U5K51_00465 [Flavobacteriaceae bacterium]|nr:hypothetical protein [Flavobacteriaceae bacterium]